MQPRLHLPERGLSRPPAWLIGAWFCLTGGCLALACDPESPPGGCDEAPCGGAAGETGSPSAGASGTAGAPSGGSAGDNQGGGAGGGNSAGVGGDAAGAATSGGASGEAGEGGAAGQPSSTFCGDAIRDPVLEGCDDGTGSGADSCNETCEVQSAPLIPRVEGLRKKTRRLGFGRHVVAAQRTGIAVSFVETESSKTSVKLSLLDRFGRRHGTPTDVSGDAMPPDDADPVVASLPSGAWAVAFADLVGGSLDIALRRLDGEGEITARAVANAITSGAQHSPDLLWVDGEVHVAWTDALAVKVRTFSADFEPTASEARLFEGDFVSHVALAEHQGKRAAAARRQVGSLERIDVLANGAVWQTAPFVPGAASERPALLSLGEGQLLLAFTEGTDPETSGTPNVFRLAIAVLDSNEPGETSHFSLPLLLEPWASDESIAQRRPALARVGTRLFIAWETETPDAKQRLFLQELDWDASSKTLTARPETPLRADAPSAGPERAPAFAATPLFPQGALAIAWEEVHADGVAAPDIMFSLRPSPFVF